MRLEEGQVLTGAVGFKVAPPDTEPVEGKGALAAAENDAGFGGGTTIANVSAW